MRMKEDNYYRMLPKNSSMYLTLLYSQRTGRSHQDCLLYIKGTSPLQIHFDSRFFFLCLCFQIINNTCSIREAHLLKPSSGKFSPSRLFFVCYRIQFTSHDKSPGPSPYLSIGLDFPFPKAFHGLFVTTSVSLTCRLECPTATSALSHKKDLSIQGVVSGILLTFHTYYPGVGELHFRKQRRQKIQNATPAFHSEVYQGEPWYAWEPGSGGSP